MRRAAGLLPALLLSGCYYYRPLLRTPEPEAYVSVALSDSGTLRLWPYLGPDVGTLRGRLLAVDDTAFTLSVDAVDLRQGSSLSWKGERATVRRELVEGLSDRHFSVGRTSLVGVLSTAALLVTVQAFKVFGSGGSSSGGGGKPR